MVLYVYGSACVTGCGVCAVYVGDGMSVNMGLCVLGWPMSVYVHVSVSVYFHHVFAFMYIFHWSMHGHKHTLASTVNPRLDFTDM